MRHGLKGNWLSIPYDHRVSFIKLVPKEVILNLLSPNIFQLTVRWTAPSWGEVVAIEQRSGKLANAHWTPEEPDALRSLPAESTAEEVMQALPRRSFISIRERVYTLGLPLRSTRTEQIPAELSIGCWADIAVQRTCGLAQASSNLERASRFH